MPSGPVVFISHWSFALVVIARDETIAKSVNNETLHHMSC